MKSNSIKELRLGLDELEKYIKYNSLCNKLISEENGSLKSSNINYKSLIEISKSFRRKKIFEYNSYIITLYGQFERFLENILSEYLNTLCLILKKYERLPSQLKRNNLLLNIDLLKNLSNPKFNGISTKEFIYRLNQSINEDLAVLNFEAFQHHPYNFKQNIISEFFGNVGLTELNGQLKLCDPLMSLLSDSYGNISNLSSETLFRIIDDLAQRRNDVAHGVENVELINVSIIQEYITYIRSYCESLYIILKNELLEKLFIECKPNFNLINVFDNSIVCGSIQYINIEIGDYLLIKKQKSNFPRYIISPIEEIQKDNIPKEKIYATNKINVGLKVKDQVKYNCEYIIIKAKSIENYQL